MFKVFIFTEIGVLLTLDGLLFEEFFVIRRKHEAIRASASQSVDMELISWTVYIKLSAKKVVLPAS